MANNVGERQIAQEEAERREAEERARAAAAAAGVSLEGGEEWWEEEWWEEEEWGEEEVAFHPGEGSQSSTLVQEGLFTQGEMGASNHEGALLICGVESAFKPCVKWVNRGNGQRGKAKQGKQIGSRTHPGYAT